MAKVSQVESSAQNKVRLYYDSEMRHTDPGNSDDSLNPANYAFSSVGGTPVSAASVSLAQTSPTIVDLVLSGDASLGVVYLATVSNVLTLGGDPLPGPPDNQGYFAVIETPVKLTAAEVLDKNHLKLTWNRPMDKSDLAVLAYFTLSPVSSGASPAYISDVELPSGLFPDNATLEISEGTDGKTYRIQVSDSVRDKWGALMDPGFDELTFLGVGDSPAVARVVSLSRTSARVYFSEAMTDNPSLWTPGKYLFSDGLTVSRILQVGQNYVDLETSSQVEGTLYTLTVNP